MPKGRRYIAALAASLLAASALSWLWMRHLPAFDMRARLAALADESGALDNPFERNADRAAALLAAARGEAADGRRRFELRREAARQLMLAGAAEPAIAELQALLLDAAPQEAEALTFELALAYLRLGEVQNCVGAHNADSCLIPIRRPGVHARRLGSEQAARLFEELLSAPAPDPALVPTYQWLLNIAHMTLGQYPEGVPARWRIPPSAFDSDHDIGRFRDVALQKGLAILARAGGAILDDFDRDGHLDLMTSSWGNRDPLQYFRNRGDGTFADLSNRAGLDGLTGGLDIFPGDFDNDGFLDVFVPRGAWTHRAGQIPASLLQNKGNNTFTDVTARAGLLSAYPSQAAVWCDLDNDGWLDLVKGNELHPDVDWPADAPSVQLFRNNHDGSFTDVAVSAGLRFRGMVKAAVCGDYDNDGRQDLYFSVLYSRNRLYRNLGGLRFDDVTDRAGVAEPVMSFTSWFFDYDNDGWEDLFVAGYRTDMSNVALKYLGRGKAAQGEHPRLYRNNGDGSFTDVAQQVGLGEPLLPMGANFGDLDNDGWLDFYLGTGAPPVQILDPSRMFRNDGGRRFQDVTTSGGFGHLQKGHGVAFGDYDGDGDQDLFEQIGGAFEGDRFWSVLFENPGHGHRWITLRLEGVASNRPAIGAKIHLRLTTPAGPRELYRVVSSGGSFGASSLQQEIGLADASSLDLIEIRWPCGAQQRWAGPIAMDRVYVLTEGQASLR